MHRFASIMILPAALAACSESAADPRGVDRQETLLQVAASAQAEAQPTEARFTAGVETIAPTAAAASAGNNAVINRVLAAVERLGVKKEDVQTRNVTLGRIDYGPNRGRFQANNMFEVRVRNVGRAGEAITAATEAGANVVSGPNLTVGDPEAATRSAYAQAYRAARARAEVYAAAAGLKIVRVLAIRDAGGSSGADYGTDIVMAEAAYAPPPPISRTAAIRPGTTTGQVHVRADFALAAK